MTNLMVFDQDQINVKQGLVEFSGFEKLKQEALQLSEQIVQVEVTDENVKTSKQLLAAVNKRVKEMEDRRISIKKEMLEPYDNFEQQVKEIVSIVKDADKTVRQQVRDLEETQRESKKSEIKDLFEKRIKQYSFGDILNFDHFITPKHLNKSTSMKSVETEMVDWLEKKDSDMKVINNLPNKHDVLMEYMDTKDLSIAMNIVSEHERRKEELKKAAPSKKEDSKVEQSFVVTINDEKDYKLVEMFMDQNDIEYTIKKETV